MANSLYPSLDLPSAPVSALKRGTCVQTRYFYADSLPGAKATVVRHWESKGHHWVRLNYGKNLGGQSILKTMPLDALALVTENSMESN